MGLACFTARASKLDVGFGALAIYDYFKAKKIFLALHKDNKDAYATYGLAVIFSRNDNPFASLDSASRYIHLSYSSFIQKPETRQLATFTVDSSAILGLARLISSKQFTRVKKANSVWDYENFMRMNYLGSSKLLSEARFLRDEIEFNRTLQVNKSDSTGMFILLHPQSAFLTEALLLRDRQLYDEMTEGSIPSAFISFIQKYPGNAMINTAYERLFAIYRKESDTRGLAFFVASYPQAPQNIEAWKLLFSLKVKTFSFAGLKNFLQEYPAFPLKNSILKELELNKLVLYPYQRGDYKGFIDAKGKFVIKPVYDAATDFSEGLSVVNKNDSVFFINKENVNPFDKVYADASAFRNGIAPVKLNNKWFFINRQGQTVSKTYDEISELYNSVYVVKVNEKYGALDHFGQMILEPRFDKLGDFKNDMAYYSENGNFGFVSRSGTVHKAEFEWISDFSPEQIAVFRQNGKYGLVNAFGKKILEPEFDHVVKSNAGIFVVVSNASYGFYSSAGCFLTPVVYDYNREKNGDYYSNGQWLRLVKKGDQAFADENGRLVINYSSYEEINFPSNGLMRIKQKGRYGYLDKKLNPAVPCKYQFAEDFTDSLALVKQKDVYIMINTEGKEVFSNSLPVEKISRHYYFVKDEIKIVFNQKGEIVFTDVDNFQKVSERIILVTLLTDEIKLLYD